MTEESFITLLNIFCDDITVNYVQSERLTSGNTPIYLELVVVLASVIWVVMHSRHWGIFGMSDSSAERVMKMFIRAVLLSDHPLLE
jgi:hypothetical protein